MGGEGITRVDGKNKIAGSVAGGDGMGEVAAGAVDMKKKSCLT